MAELSRGELLAWVNDLTNLNLPKVEAMGTGSAHCLIIHSIFGDVPTHKINFKAVHEYEYVHNFKVLQEAFTRHRIDRTIPVDKLIKLKFQDNLEFLQWMKKFWDANYDGGNVSASTSATATASGAAAIAQKPIAPSTFKTSNNLSRASSVNKRPNSSSSIISSSTAVPNSQIPNTQSAPSQPTSATAATNALQLAALTKTITELKLSVDEMEKERDFYFNKLRDIEILTQKISDPVITSSIFFKQITEILYTTEEGFEIPQENGAPSAVKDDTVMSNAA